MERRDAYRPEPSRFCSISDTRAPHGEPGFSRFASSSIIGRHGVEQADRARQTRMGVLLPFVTGLEPAPPVDELPDQGARRNLLEGHARKSLYPEGRFHIAKTAYDIACVLFAEDERALRRARTMRTSLSSGI
jgi:hypothetical protein